MRWNNKEGRRKLVRELNAAVNDRAALDTKPAERDGLGVACAWCGGQADRVAECPYCTTTDNAAQGDECKHDWIRSVIGTGDEYCRRCAVMRPYSPDTDPGEEPGEES